MEFKSIPGPFALTQHGAGSCIVGHAAIVPTDWGTLDPAPLAHFCYKWPCLGLGRVCFQDWDDEKLATVPTLWLRQFPLPSDSQVVGLAGSGQTHLSENPFCPICSTFTSWPCDAGSLTNYPGCPGLRGSQGCWTFGAKSGKVPGKWTNWSSYP